MTTVASFPRRARQCVPAIPFGSDNPLTDSLHEELVERSIANEQRRQADVLKRVQRRAYEYGISRSVGNRTLMLAWVLGNVSGACFLIVAHARGWY